MNTKISICGNISCGKTTLLKKLNKELDYKIFLEPLDEWKEILNLFYQDQKRWAFTFGVQVLLSYAHGINTIERTLYERSPIDCKYVFNQISYEDKNLTEEELNIFNDVYHKIGWKPDIFIYLRTTPEVCFERMNKRNRDCEKNVSLEYLKKIHEKYEEFMINNHKLNQKNIFIIDGDKSEKEVFEEIINIFNNKLN